MRRAALGTVAVHTLIAIAFVLIGGREDAEPAAAPEPSISLVDIISTAPNIPPAPPSLAATSGGGSPAPARPARLIARPAPRVLHGDRVGDVLGAAAVDIDPGGGAGDGGGFGHGHGGGIGDGIGRGAGGELDPPPPPPPAPPPPKISKARPPRLIFPTRSRDVDEEEEPFIAAITVDTDGYVVGAHLIRGHGNPRNLDATRLIFLFRYDPALDDDGRAITAHIEQPFLVE